MNVLVISLLFSISVFVFMPVFHSGFSVGGLSGIKLMLYTSWTRTQILIKK